MRVLMISKALVVGAYQSKAEELARLPGLELMVAAPRSWIQEGKRMPLERRCTAGYRLEAEPMALNGHFHVHWYPLLRRRFSRFRPHLVHIDEEPYNLATLQALLLARQYGARTVFFTWQNQERRYPGPFTLMERYVLARADFCIAGNQEAAEIQRKKGFRRGIAVIPQFGVDPELFRPRACQRPDGPTVGFAGRLVEQKGLWVLCQAFERLPADCRLLLVGSGPLEAPLRERAERAGWAARLTIARASSTDMPGFYNRMDCLVLPSLTTPSWKEQFGRAAIEALACQVPVIGSDSGEIPHLLRGLGRVVPEGDAQSLAAEIERLLGDPAGRKELGARGRQAVIERFTQRRIAEQTHQVYRAMLKA
ncbi:MAG: glycosyltransferase [Chloroflexota bacterium]